MTLKPRGRRIFGARIHELRNIGGRYLEMTVVTDEEYLFQSGQYTVMSLQKNGQSIQNYYSIASAPNQDGNIDFCLQLDQNPETSAILHAIEIGDHVELSAPSGNFLWPQNSAKCNVLIAGGSGIAPLRAHAQNALKHQTSADLYLIYGCSSGLAVPYEQELIELTSKYPQLHLQIIVEEHARTTQKKGLVTDIVSEHLDSNFHYFLCGPRGMINAVECLLEKADIPEEHIFHEGRKASKS